MGKAAVFLDRDDTLIENVPYLGDPEKLNSCPEPRRPFKSCTNKSSP